MNSASAVFMVKQTHSNYRLTNKPN